MFYFAPINTPNNNLKAGDSVIGEIVGIDSMHNQIWFNNNNAHLGNIAKLYKAVTGKDIDPNVGFAAKEIMNKSVQATITESIGKNGVRYVRLKDYKAV